MKREDPWADAICRQDQHYEWAREHGASMWDWVVGSETPYEKQKRINVARTACVRCPLKAKCLALHDELVAASAFQVSGVWGGRVFKEKTDDDRPAVAA